MPAVQVFDHGLWGLDACTQHQSLIFSKVPANASSAKPHNKGCAFKAIFTLLLCPNKSTYCARAVPKSCQKHATLLKVKGQRGCRYNKQGISLSQYLLKKAFLLAESTDEHQVQDLERRLAELNRDDEAAQASLQEVCHHILRSSDHFFYRAEC